jgi:four helix bundle protein
MKKEIRSFEDLEVWKICREIRKKIFKLVKNFPVEEKYSLVVQIRKAAISVTANIAEGYGRFHYQENIQFCRQARGSLYELLDHLTTSLDEGYMSVDEMNGLKKLINSAIKLLNGYIRMLQKRKNNE